MCRNIKPLFNYNPPASEEEVHDASLQFVRKLSGFNKPAQVNEAVFNRAVDEVTKDAQILLNSLETNAKPHNRAVEAERARARNKKRFGAV